MTSINDPAAPRSRLWTWWICLLLLFASTINYMDRQTLSNAATEIQKELGLSNAKLGELETAFGIAFAVGCTVFGFLADHVNIRWLYPCVLLLWSAVGVATGFSRDYTELMLCRTMLGFFEAGHWPCALKTTLRLLEAKDRALGNSVLQSGTALGAIVTPQIMRMMMTDQAGSWRPVFQIIGGIGIFWVFAWLISIRTRDLAPLPEQTSTETKTHSRFPWRRAAALVIVVILINTSWHLFRFWLPLFLEKGHGYSRDQRLNINTLFHIATDVGCLGAGGLSFLLIRNRVSVLRSRLYIFTGGALLAALSATFPWLSRGPGLILVLMIVGAGLLAMFPCFYTFAQELSKQHPGKAMGMLGTLAWIASAISQKLFGEFLDQDGSFATGMAIAGVLPLGAALALWLLWGKDEQLPSGSELSHA